MKTTLELSEKLLRETKKFAAQNGLSMKSVFEMALRNLLERRRTSVKFSLRKATFKGQGVFEDIQEGDWSAIREKIYKGRGA